MIILGIETSCDETAAAVLEQKDGRIQILSNIVSSSASLQEKYGGVLPEQAAREQLKSIIPVVNESLNKAYMVCHPELDSGSTNKMLKPASRQGGQVQHDNKEMIKDIDAIAVTEGPGLIGSLLVGVETAKTLAMIWQKPLIPVNHLLGHFYANWIVQSSDSLRADRSPRRPILKTESSIPSFPAIGLLVSGGHTDLVLFTDHGKYKYLGGTRDDAAGECFDKCARLLDLPYPGGPNLSKLAEKGNPKAFKLPRPMINSKDFDFSFSGLKTAVANLVKEELDVGSGRMDKEVRNLKLDNQKSNFQYHNLSSNLQHLTASTLANLAASIEDAITDVLVEKTVRAVQTYNVNQLIIAGGVAANKILLQKLTQSMSEFCPRAEVFIPPPSLCTDNAAYIAAAAFFNLYPIDPLKLQANPNLSLAY